MTEKKAFRSLLFALLSFLMLLDLAAEEKPIVVVIPSYKNSQWYEKNLNSVFSQNYSNFRVIYIDDASPDRTGELVQAYIEAHNLQDQITLIRNPKRVGALANLHKGFWMCEPHEIVANLDGDDWFYHDNVLAKLNEVYADPNVWLTYGQFIYWPADMIGFAEEVPYEVVANNAFREHSGGTTALRTFYAGLFHKVNINDLLYEGNFFPSAWDLAMMWPMLEMAGFHTRFIPEPMYVYNIDNPINDFKVDISQQAHLDRTTRKMPRYSPLERLFD